MTPQLLGEYFQTLRTNLGTAFIVWAAVTITVVVIVDVARGNRKGGA